MNEYSMAAVDSPRRMRKLVKCPMCGRLYYDIPQSQMLDELCFVCFGQVTFRMQQSVLFPGMSLLRCRHISIHTRATKMRAFEVKIEEIEGEIPQKSG